MQQGTLSRSKYRGKASQDRKRRDLGGFRRNLIVKVDVRDRGEGKDWGRKKKGDLVLWGFIEKFKVKARCERR